MRLATYALEQSLDFLKGFVARNNAHHDRQFRCSDGTMPTYRDGSFDRVVGVIGDSLPPSPYSSPIYSGCSGCHSSFFAKPHFPERFEKHENTPFWKKKSQLYCNHFGVSEVQGGSILDESC
ncbi:hypothetical protein CEXT_763181 [Caerostris extrusa]|uniref:Uncharacterized protein n=1 Tax=Caerostris extrusa TaxID=172846 RepID=A0AAV4MQU2_CAEEX|nr:hypothetical protein CEXT_763181 [Caerostris extrusa]